MKKLTVTIAAVIITLTTMAQEQTLLKADLHNGGYGALSTKIGGINGKSGTFIGGQAAWVINHTFAIGGKGYVLISPYEVSGLENIKMEFACWGGLLEYIIASDNLVHLNINAMIGAGSVRYSVKDWQDDHGEVDFTEDAFFAIEPGIDAEFNIHKNFRISVGVYYRIVSGIDYADLTNKGMCGLSGQITLKFGAF